MGRAALGVGAHPRGSLRSLERSAARGRGGRGGLGGGAPGERGLQLRQQLLQLGQVAVALLARDRGFCSVLAYLLACLCAAACGLDIALGLARAQRRAAAAMPRARRGLAPGRRSFAATCSSSYLRPDCQHPPAALTQASLYFRPSTRTGARRRTKTEGCTRRPRPARRAPRARPSLPRPAPASWPPAPARRRRDFHRLGAPPAPDSPPAARTKRP